MLTKIQRASSTSISTPSQNRFSSCSPSSARKLAHETHTISTPYRKTSFDTTLASPAFFVVSHTDLSPRLAHPLAWSLIFTYLICGLSLAFYVVAGQVRYLQMASNISALLSWRYGKGIWIRLFFFFCSFEYGTAQK